MSLPLIIAAAAGVYLIAGKKKSGTKSSSKGASCPASLEFDVEKLQNYATEIDYQGGTLTVNTPADALRAHDAGENDIIAIAKTVLARQIPRRCMEDFGVQVTVKSSDDSKTFSAPVVVFHVAAGVGSDFAQMGRYSDDDVAIQMANIKNW